MKICTSVILIFVVTATSLPAGIPSKGAAYHGGTTKDRDFPGIKKEVVGVLDTSDPEALVFTYRLEKKNGAN